jgi:hypothetical protein
MPRTKRNSSTSSELDSGGEKLQRPNMPAEPPDRRGRFSPKYSVHSEHAVLFNGKGNANRGTFNSQSSELLTNLGHRSLDVVLAESSPIAFQPAHTEVRTRSSHTPAPRAVQLRGHASVAQATGFQCQFRCVFLSGKRGNPTLMRTRIRFGNSDSEDSRKIGADGAPSS